MGHRTQWARYPFLGLIALLTACSVSPGAIATTPGQQISPSQPPAQVSSPPPGVTPTIIPTLGKETEWLEPAAERGILISRTSSSRGEDLFLISPNGHAPVFVPSPKRGVDESVSVSPNGQFAAVQSATGVGAYDETLTIIDLVSQRQTTITDDTELSRRFAWSPDASVLAFIEVDASGASNLKLYSINDGESSTVLSDAGSWLIQDWSPNNDQILLIRVAGGGLPLDGAALMDIDTGEVEPVYEDKQQVTNWIIPSPDGRLLLIVRGLASEDHQAGELSVLDLGTGEVRARFQWPASGAQPAGRPTWSPGGREVALTLVDPSEPGTLAPMYINILNLETEEARTIVKVDEPAMLIQALAWVSNEVLIANNIRGERGNHVLYSIREDGSAIQRIAEGRFLDTVPLD